MHQQIQSKLDAIQRIQGIRILYACESGSRAWGFASDDSDYDVRFIYAHSPEWYVSVHDRDETIDLPIDNDLDFAGWDIRKALRLFHKSNGALIEWLHSPIVYRENPSAMSAWRALIPETVNLRALGSHYLGQSKRVWLTSLQEGSISAKKYLYALRCLLAAQWIVDCKKNPPVPFKDLVANLPLDNSVRDHIEGLLDLKQAGTEGSTMEPDSVLHPFIGTCLEEINTTLENIAAHQPDSGAVDALLLEIIQSNHSDR
jgi:predicted nucleotidyltransferase